MTTGMSEVVSWDRIHTIPVPRHYTVHGAWHELLTFGRFPEHRWWNPRFWRMGWANVRVPAGGSPYRDYIVVDVEMTEPDDG